MIRTQIQLPEPLFRRLKEIASARDWSLAELVRRAAEVYVQTCIDVRSSKEEWTLPVLRGSGGYLVDPATVSSEEQIVEDRYRGTD